VVARSLKVLDPFYWFDRVWFALFGKPKRLSAKIAYEIGQIAFAFLLAYVIYVVAGIILHTSKPAVVVASSSMVPTLHVGDIAIVEGTDFEHIRAPEVDVNEPLRYRTLSEAGIKIIHHGLKAVAIVVNGKRIPIERNGDIIVYHNEIQNKDIIHRVVLKIRASDGDYVLTKGDNEQTNFTLDQDCFMGACTYPYPVPMKNVYGKVIFVIPYIGLIKIWLLGP